MQCFAVQIFSYNLSIGIYQPIRRDGLNPIILGQFILPALQIGELCSGHVVFLNSFFPSIGLIIQRNAYRSYLYLWES